MCLKSPTGITQIYSEGEAEGSQPGFSAGRALSRHLRRLEGGRERRQLGQGTALCQAADKDGRSSWHGVESSPAKAAASNQRFLTGRR
ncbi:uncharacterized [Tachysurus ichikawai]